LSFSAICEAAIDFMAVAARLEAVPFQNNFNLTQRNWDQRETGEAFPLPRLGFHQLEF